MPGDTTQAHSFLDRVLPPDPADLYLPSPTDTLSRSLFGLYNADRLSAATFPQHHVHHAPLSTPHPTNLPITHGIPSGHIASSTMVPYTVYMVGPFVGPPDPTRPGLPPLQHGVQTAVPFVFYVEQPAAVAASSSVPISPAPALPDLLGGYPLPHPASAEAAAGVGPMRNQHPLATRFSPYNSRVPSAYTSDQSLSFNPSALGDLAEGSNRLEVSGVGGQADSRANMPRPSNALLKSVVDAASDHYCVIMMTTGPVIVSKMERTRIIKDALLRAELDLKLHSEVLFS